MLCQNFRRQMMIKRIEEKQQGEEEAQKANMLKHLGGAGVINQRTGFPSFDALKEISKRKIEGQFGGN